MLKKENRLHLKKDFQCVFEKGNSRFNKYFGIKFLANELDFSRFAFIVSKKISKKAVVRNKVKRRLRAVVLADLKNIKTGYDVIIICLPSVLELDYHKMQQILLENFSNANLFLK